MPINEPYKQRTIVPDALAFPVVGGGAGGSGVTTYQQELTTRVEVYNTTIVADKQYVNRTAGQTMANVALAERRAKAQVGEWHFVTEWDINDDVTLTWGTWVSIGFQREVLRAQGVQCDTRFRPTEAAWYHIVQPGQEGKWWYYTKLFFATPGTVANTTDGYLAFSRNGTIVRIVDMATASTWNQTDLENLFLGGGCHIDVRRGDYIEVQVFLRGTGVGDVLFTAPGSVYGYVTASRQSCDFDRENSPTTGVNFVPA